MRNTHKFTNKWANRNSIFVQSGDGWWRIHVRSNPFTALLRSTYRRLMRSSHLFIDLFCSFDDWINHRTKALRPKKQPTMHGQVVPYDISNIWVWIEKFPFPPFVHLQTRQASRATRVHGRKGLYEIRVNGLIDVPEWLSQHPLGYQPIIKCWYSVARARHTRSPIYSLHLSWRVSRLSPLHTGFPLLGQIYESVEEKLIDRETWWWWSMTND